MIIEKGKDILCMRFANLGGHDCIDEHKKVINEKGFVWFGKIGNKPTDKALDKMIENESKYILLKEPQKAYICRFESYSHEIPAADEFPNYYSTEILPTRSFSIWFKLASIMEVDNLSVLNNIVLKSSRNPILETTKKSMASHFYTVTRENIDFYQL